MNIPEFSPGTPHAGSDNALLFVDLSAGYAFFMADFLSYDSEIHQKFTVRASWIHPGRLNSLP
jgi:hypothetical protein